MNVLFIYHEYGDGRWLQYTTALERLGHRVDIVELRTKWEPGQVSFRQLQPWHQVVWINSADYVWHGAVPADFLQAVKDGGLPLLGYLTLKADVPYATWFEIYRLFDLCFVQSRHVTRLAEQHGIQNAYHLPYGFDPSLYRKLDVTKDIAVSFAGSPEFRRPGGDDRRARIVGSLKELGIQLFGEKFAGRVDPSIPVHPFRTQAEMNSIYNRSKINLDIPSVVSDFAEMATVYHPKFRLFDVPGSGNFLLGGYAEEFDEAFRRGVHCDYYDDIESIPAMVDHYLTHEKERMEIERAGHCHALAHHTQEAYLKAAMQRVEELLLKNRKPSRRGGRGGHGLF